MSSLNENENNLKGEKLILDKTKNAKNGIISGVVNKVVTLLIPFIVRTLFIRIIGIEYAGLNSLFTSILQVLNLAELGFSSAVIYSMYKPVADRDDETVCSLLNFYRKVYKVVGMVILCSGILVLPFITQFVNGNPPEDINLYVVYLIFLFNTSISYLLYGYKTSLLYAYQRTDVINNIGTITTMALNLVHIVILLLIPNYYLYIIFLPLSTIVNNVLLSVMVDKKFPQYKCKGTISNTMRKDIWKKITGLAIQKICAKSRDMFNSIFISVFLSLALVGIYNNYYMIMSALTGIMSIIIRSMNGAIGNTVATATVEENYRILQKFNCMFMWISTIVAVSLFMLYQPFMQLWMGNEYMLGNNTIVLLTLYFFVLRMGDIRSIWVDAAGLFWEIRWRAILEAVLNIVLVYVFVQLWGINGMLMGTLISLFFINFVYGTSITFKYYFGYKLLGRYYFTQFVHLLVLAVICGMSYIVCVKVENLFDINNLWLSIFGRLGISIIVSNLVLYTFIHNTVDYKLAVEWLKLKFKKSKY